MRKILLLAIAVTAAHWLPAQSLESYKEHLAHPAEAASTSAVVTVAEHGSAATAVREASRTGIRLRFKGYRVCIFNDNHPGARDEAFAAKELFEERFPGTKAYVDYANPYFRVSVGDCVTAEEAIMLLGRVSGVFPKAFLKNEELSVADLVRE